MTSGDVEAHQLNNQPYGITNIDEAEQCRDNVTIAIEEKLGQLSHIGAECSIYRVPKRLLDMNRIAYVPQVISIGPFHRDEQAFMTTEELKLRFFNSFQCCIINMNVQDIMKNVRSWETRARSYYAEPVNLNSDDFVKMMLLDGCFVVKFMMIACGEFPPNEKEVHFSFYKAIWNDIYGDLLMLENQLPFFVIQNLFDLISPTIEKNVSFDKLVHKFLNGRVAIYGLPYRNAKHLVDFLRFYYDPLASENCAEKYRNCVPPNVTELCEAGIVLKKATGKKHIMGISFKDGVLEIPPFEIDDIFETYVRNLMAFEQFPMESKNYATHYVVFLDELISTENDVRLLVKKEIIKNSIGGSNKEISKLFNDLCKNITVEDGNYFGNISEDLRKHCKRRRNRWMASLKHNYFNTPWAFISFLAATFLIILTFLQTVFSAM